MREWIVFIIVIFPVRAGVDMKLVDDFPNVEVKS